MKKIAIAFGFMVVLVSQCVGLSRQDKDALANAYVARFFGGSKGVNAQVSALDCDEVAVLLLSDVLIARVGSTGPKRNDLFDRILSQCDPVILQHIAFLESHPAELQNFWKQFWLRMPEPVRQKLFKDKDSVIHALTYMHDVAGKLDELVPLAREWELADESEELLATARFAPLRTLIQASEEAEAWCEDFDLVDAVTQADVRLKDVSGVIQTYYGLNPLTCYEDFKKQALSDMDKALEQLPQLMVQGGALFLALMGKTSIKACAQAFKDFCCSQQQC